MSKYIHKINYYETDKMGITHHSNYIRFMEEARLNFLTEIGCPMMEMEEKGIYSPVISVNCEYKHATTYGDEIEIEMKLEKYTEARIFLSYIMKNINTGEIVATATSTHCFIDEKGRAVAMRKRVPEFYAKISKLMETEHSKSSATL